MVRLGFRYAVSWRRLFTSVDENLVFSKISGSGRKFTQVPVCLVLPSLGRSPSQFNRGNTSLIMIVMYKSVTADLNIQICGQGIYNGRTNAMKSTACLISRVVKFTACMEGGKYKTLCRYPFRMHIYRNTASIISDRTGAVFLQCYFNIRTVTGQMLIYALSTIS